MPRRSTNQQPIRGGILLSTMYLLGTLLETCEIRSGTQTQQTYTHTQKQQLHLPICFQKTSNKVWGLPSQVDQTEQQSEIPQLPYTTWEKWKRSKCRHPNRILDNFGVSMLKFQKNNHIGLRNTQQEAPFSSVATRPAQKEFPSPPSRRTCVRVLAQGVPLRAAPSALLAGVVAPAVRGVWFFGRRP